LRKACFDEQRQFNSEGNEKEVDMSRMTSKGKPADCDRVAGGTSCLIFQSKPTSKKFCTGCIAYSKKDSESLSEVLSGKKNSGRYFKEFGIFV
jgi:hypothetical protein